MKREREVHDARPVGRAESLATRGLPPDLLRDSARRLGLAGLVYGIGFAIQIALNQLFDYLGWARPQTFLARTVIQACSVMLGLAVFAYARRSGLAVTRVVAIGIAFEIMGGFLIVLAENLTLTAADTHGMTGVSLLAVWIVIFPLLVPARPWLSVAAGFATASTSPLAMALLTRLGFPSPAVSTLTFAYLPNYVVAILGAVPAIVLYRMRRQIAEARALGSYQLVEKLGAGGMGEVWRASHRMLARPAAIKLIAHGVGGTLAAPERDELVRRFEREAQATATLSSPHTVALYDFGVTEDGTFYYVMELLRGMNLHDLVDRFGPLPPERAIALLVQVCESLEEAHAHGLVHRDIKPANIHACVYGGRHDFVKVLDFGLVSRHVPDAPEESRLTQAHTARGTPAFMPPEMASGGAVDGRTDLYALGCVAYWLLTGSLPFKGRSVLEVISQHLHVAPEPPSRRTPSPLPPEIDGLVLRCMAKQPAERPASARELRRILEAIPVARPWTEERAAQWWSQQMPESTARGEGAATAAMFVTRDVGS